MSSVHAYARLDIYIYSVQSCRLVLGRPSLVRSGVRLDLISCRYEYLWEDGVKYKRPTKLPAPEYVDALMNWAQGLLDNEEIFPNKIGKWPPAGKGRKA